MIPTKKKYKWERTADGRYNIYGVDIFKAFEEEEKKEIIAKKDIIKIVENFNNDKKNDWLPRVHLGHQDYSQTMKNCEGIGYLDKIVFEKNTFYADLIDIPIDIFEKIMQRKYPYRSVELDILKKKIVGLALLESRPPFFSFPVLDLEQFNQFNSKSQIILFSEGMMELEKQESKEDIEPTNKETKEEPTSEKKKDELPDNAISFLSLEEIQQLRNFLSVSDKLLGLANMADKIALGTIKPEKESIEKKEPKEEEVSPAGIPEVLTCELKSLRERISKFEKDHDEIGIYAQLKDICDKDISLDFMKEKKFIEKFESKNDKKKYIEHLESKQGDYEEHFISQFASKFTGNSGDLKQYESLAGEARNVYLKAKRDYIDTINNKKTVQQFSALFPTMKDYIDTVLMEFEVTGTYRPDYI